AIAASTVAARDVTRRWDGVDHERRCTRLINRDFKYSADWCLRLKSFLSEWVWVGADETCAATDRKVEEADSDGLDRARVYRVGRACSGCTGCLWNMCGDVCRVPDACKAGGRDEARRVGRNGHGCGERRPELSESSPVCSGKLSSPRSGGNPAKFLRRRDIRAADLWHMSFVRLDRLKVGMEQEVWHEPGLFV